MPGVRGQSPWSLVGNLLDTVEQIRWYKTPDTVWKIGESADSVCAIDKRSDSRHVPANDDGLKDNWAKDSGVYVR
jgi:hypothetical protein